MSRQQESKWNLDELTDADICTAIRYLDPDPIPGPNGENNPIVLVICLSFLVLLLGCVALLWLFSRSSW
jgi:hypothetical protein